jgi:uncharacterized repeat protein (TIGR01451 family)
MVVQVQNPIAAGTISFNPSYEDDDTPPIFPASPIVHNVTASAAPPSDLIIRKDVQTVTPGQVTAGGPSTGGLDPNEIRYTLSVFNNGPNPVTLDADGFVIVFDVIPANVQTVGSVTAPSGWICSGFSPGNLMSCIRTGPATIPVNPSAALQFSYTVSVPADVPKDTIINNTALVYHGGGNDPTPSNNVSPTTSTRVATSSNLHAQKNVDNNNVTAGGGTFTYTINVTNQGPSDAQNVVINDQLPPGILFVALETGETIYGRPSCNAPDAGSNGLVSCVASALKAGDTAQVRIIVRAAAGAAGGNSRNCVNVAAETPDPDSNNNGECEDVNINIDAPLVIEKFGPTEVCAGDLITYRVRLINTGQSIARNVTLSDQLPDNTTFVNLIGAGALHGACIKEGSVNFVTCGNLAAPLNVPPGPHSLDITLKVNTNAPTGPLTNTVTITDPGTGSISGSASASATATVKHCADLEIVKDDSPDAVKAGELINYSIRVKNIGPSDLAAGEATVSDLTFPPAGTTLQGTIGVPTGWSCAGPTSFPCTNSTGALPVGATATITFQVKVNPDFNGGLPGATVDNTATVGTVGGNVTDPNPSNNTSTVKTPIGPNADLQLTKTASPASVVAGDPASIITYTINYRNGGLGDAVNVVISDTVPANLLAVGTINAPGLSCHGATATPGAQFNCSPNANAFGTHAAGVLPANASGTMSFQVRAPANVAAGTLVSNAANIASTGNNSTPDPNTANNKQATSTLVTTSADLSITKTDTPDPVLAGQNITYTINFSNAGPSDAQNVVVNDPLPPGTTLVSVNGSDNSVSCTQADNTVSCNKATLAAGASASITLVVRVNPGVPSGTVLTNTATIGSSTSDPVSNNSSTTTTTVNTDANVTIVKADNPDPVIAGTNLTYRITVANSGPSNGRNVVITDTLPNSPANAVSFIAANGTGALSAAGVCTHSAGVVTCQAGGPDGLVLPAGVSWNLDIVVRVNSNVPANTVLTNNVQVQWTDTDSTPGTATDSETTTVIHNSDMTISKEAPDEVIAGNRMDYRLIVVNRGPSDVNGDTTPGSITIMDTLPTGVMPAAPVLSGANLTISGPGGFTCSYDSGANKITCVNAAGTAGDFPVGSVLTIIFKVEVKSNVPDNTNLNNCANVMVRGEPDPTPEVDPITGNNESCDATTVHTLADLGVAKTATAVADAPGQPTVPLPTPGPNVPPGSVSAGGYIRYDVPFGNAGPSDAVNVRLTDVVPGNTALVSPSTNPFSITATKAASPNINLDCSVGGQAGSQQITCVPMGNGGAGYTDGVLPAGYQGTLTFYVKVNESVSGGTIVANGANITSAPNGSTPGTPDPNPGNNTSLQTSTVVIASSNLAITKAILSATFAQSPPAQAGAVVPGTVLVYRLTITNNGPSDVSNLRVTDTLPAATDSVGRVTGAKYVTAVQSGGFGTTFTCSQPQGVNPANNPNGNGGTLQCTAPLMSANAPNNSATIDVTVFIDPATKNDLVNQTRVDATLNNFNRPTFSTFTLTTPVGPTSDLALTKTHAPDPVIAGTEFEYTVTVTNNGPSTAQMVSVVDTLPSFQKVLGIQITQSPDQNGAPNFTCAATPAIGTPGNTTSVTCTAAELPPNKKQDGTVNPAGTATFKIRVLQDPFTTQPTPTSYQNCVSATSMSFDPVAANSTNVCDTLNIIFRADLSITKTDSPDPVIAGNLLTYTMVATNAGPSAALNLMITDPLPAGTVFISAAASAGATLTTPAVGANGTVKATWAGLTGPGVSRTLTIVVRVCPDYEQSFLPSGKAMCQPNLTDTATVSSDTPDPVPGNNSATAETTVQAQSDLSISKSGPDRAPYSTSSADSIVTYTLSFSNAGPSNAAGVEVKDVLPKGFTLVSWSSTVPGTTLDPNPPASAGGIQTLIFKLGVIGAANQCSTTRPTSGTITIRAKVPIKHPTITVTNTAMISTTNCLPDPNLANNTSSKNTYIVPPSTVPGEPYPALAEVSDQKEGSILFYPIYTSDAANANTQNTRISITNTSSTERVAVHLYAVDGSSCAILDAFLCLTPNQTTTFLASDFDPGNTGYLMAVAVDENNGLPRAFNELIGDLYVKFSSGHAANLGAEAIAAAMMFPGGVNTNVTTTTLKFDGMNYNRLPRILAADNIPSSADGNSTMLIVNRVGGNFTLSGALIGGLTGLLYDDSEQSFSFTANQSSCQFRTILSNTFPRTFTPFNRVIPAGRTGWMKFWGVDDSRGSDKALFGAMINFNSGAAANAGAFNQGHNLHHLTLTDRAEIVVPVFIPSC